MTRVIPLLVLALLIGSCNQKQSNKDAYAYGDILEEEIPMTRQSSPVPPPPPPSAPNIEDAIAEEGEIKKKIIKDGRMTMQVQRLGYAKHRIDSLVQSLEGYYANESYSNTDRESSFNLNIRIPSINFEKFISAIESGEGEIQFKAIDARDVTDQFIDLETRLKNKRSYLNRYRDLLKQAKNIKEILEIEENIRGLEEEIESTVGRLKYLSDQVSYSTLDLYLFMRKDFTYNPQKQDSFFERLKQSLSKGWHAFISFLLFIIRLWPFWIVFLFVSYLWRKYRRKKKQRNTN